MREWPSQKSADILCRIKWFSRLYTVVERLAFYWTKWSCPDFIQINLLVPGMDRQKVHAVVIYHSERGTYLGSRVTKFCRNCKVYEHYGFWTEDGIKHVDTTCLENEFLLSSEDTAFHVVNPPVCQFTCCWRRSLLNICFFVQSKIWIHKRKGSNRSGQQCRW